MDRTGMLSANTGNTTEHQMELRKAELLLMVLSDIQTTRKWTDLATMDPPGGVLGSGEGRRGKMNVEYVTFGFQCACALTGLQTGHQNIRTPHYECRKAFNTATSTKSLHLCLCHYLPCMVIVARMTTYPLRPIETPSQKQMHKIHGEARGE